MDTADWTAQRHLRRNFTLGVINGALYDLSNAFLEPTLVLTWFVSQLTNSYFLIGLISPIWTGGWFLPQLIAASYLQRQERKMPLYNAMAVVRGASWGLMTLVLFLLSDRTLLLIIFFTTLIIYSLASGLAGLSFMDIVAKTILPTRLGLFFAMRSFWGGILALGAGPIVRYVLDEKRGWAFTTNFGLLFLLSFLTLSISLSTFSLVVEPIEKLDGELAGEQGQLRQAWDLLRSDRGYARFLATRLTLAMGDMATPFYIIFAKNNLGVPASIVGTYLIIATVAGLLSNFVWSHISDQRGSRLAIRLAALVGLLMPTIALGVRATFACTYSAGTGGLSSSPGLGPWVLAAVFAFMGALRSASNIAYSSYLLKLAPIRKRPTYIGFANTLIGMTTLLTGVGGLIVGLAGFEAIFALALTFYGTALLLSLSLLEPRQEVASHA
jgi:MFS family permease